MTVDNCKICGFEFDSTDLPSPLNKINSAIFKMCKDCFSSVEPGKELQEVKKLAEIAVSKTEAKRLLLEVKGDLEKLK